VTPVGPITSMFPMTVDGLRLAVGTFTAIPVPAPRRITRSTARAAMILAPLATLPIGVTAALVGVLGGWARVPDLVTAGVLIGAVALGSRGLHLDGLADTADGLSASYDRAKALEIMRRGNTGPIGAVALVIVMIVQIAAAATILGRPWGAVAVGGLVCLSRVSLLISCASGITAARPDGLGAAVAGVVPRVANGVGLEVAAGIGSLLLAITGSPWWLGIVAVVLSGLVAVLLVLRCTRRFGGISGDVLGAGIELMLAALLIVGSAG
jgi:adenosylcobinamide-GDP ribazoletransferase